MSRELRFNICGIKTSHPSNINRSQLGAQDSMSEELKYASTHWLDHLMKVQIMDDDLKRELKFFLKEKLLLWLEVLCFSEKLDVIDVFYTKFRAPSVSYLRATQL